MCFSYKKNPSKTKPIKNTKKKKKKQKKKKKKKKQKNKKDPKKSPILIPKKKNCLSNLKFNSK